MIKRFLLFLAPALLTAHTATAQNADQQIARSLQENGSFNVVLVCIGIVLIGLLIAIIRLDRKVSKLEKEQQARQS
ncbi:MAG: CcmD family protein [Bacteroidetes bacterium]|nr:CcmD family protein [Bacteroidota bacterium]